ncbi:hypothetical protein N7492_002739 [Penicillium capsulatum]|uniref:Major facilitator superfamily (MFS) profile domain-containing protein n=1 Tax=Penicillium capsulatum TaxID=69766 RepID=A0A9W9LWA7_9EURO|nr:hypothetical protein N7492_002739 [Penicillium capsulatum]KAJ6122665.1 hypothetical protein N7512_005130 [Penicillium capsulatum]
MALAEFWTQPPKYLLACILCSANGILFGMDTGIIGPVTDMKAFKAAFGGSQNATIHGLIVSSILIPAALSSFFAGHLADKLGRSLGIAIGTFIFGIGAAMEAAAVSLGMFIAGRVVEGLGEGLFLGTLVVYICEVSPTKQRGPLTTGPQLLITSGICIGYFTCYGSSKHIHSSFSWRTPFIMLASLSMILSVASLLLLPASPRWLTLHGREAEAAQAWDDLGVSHAEREKVELEVTTREVDATVEEDKGERMHKLLDIFSKDVRSRTALAVFMMAMQQLSGIDGVLYYAPLLFQQAGLTSSDASFFASGVSALVIFAVTIPGLIYADRWGRRSSIIYGGIGLATTMFAIGGLYAGQAVHSTTGAARWVVIVFIYLFAVVYSVTWAVSVKIFAAEIHPQRTRAAATTLSHSSNWLANFLVALTTPILLAKSSYGAYFLFGGCAIITSFVGFFFMHETKGRSLDEIEAAFRRKTPGPGSMLGIIGRPVKNAA